MECACMHVIIYMYETNMMQIVRIRKKNLLIISFSSPYYFIQKNVQNWNESQ